MAFKINGVEPKRILVEENGATTELIELQVYKNGSVQNVWTRDAFKVRIIKGSNSDVVVGYKDYKTYSVIYYLNDGNTIPFDGYLDITVTGKEGYSASWTLNGVAQSSANVVAKITGDMVISVTETAEGMPQYSPYITGTMEYDSYGGFYYLTCFIENPNLHAVKANIVVYSDGDRLDGTYEMSIPAETTVKYDHGEMYSVGAKVRVTFSCDGYVDSATTTTIGKYTGTVDVTEETTTTS